MQNSKFKFSYLVYYCSIVHKNEMVRKLHCFAENDFICRKRLYVTVIVHKMFGKFTMACRVKDCLRYLRKFKLLFYKIKTCLQKTITWIGLQAEQIFSVKKILSIFPNLGRGFYGSFPLLFPKAPASCRKKHFELIFAAF